MLGSVNTVGACCSCCAGELWLGKVAGMEHTCNGPCPCWVWRLLHNIAVVCMCSMSTFLGVLWACINTQVLPNALADKLHGCPPNNLQCRHASVLFQLKSKLGFCM